MLDAAKDYGDLVRRLYALGRPELLFFDDGAQAIRRALEQKHLELMALGAIHRKLAAHIGKYDGVFARLCVIWHCIEHADERLPSEVTEETAHRVARVMHGSLPHALAFYAGSSQPGRRARAPKRDCGLYPRPQAQTHHQPRCAAW